MRVLNAADTRNALGMRDAIDSLRTALATPWEVPQRQTVGTSLVMPGMVARNVGVKIVSTVPGAPAGIVVVFDESGEPYGIVHGPVLTAIRTGAVSGLATDLLTLPGVRTLAMLGAGLMARDQIDAIRTVRDIESITVWSRDPARAEKLAADVGGSAVATADKAIADADIVCTATPATTPLFDAHAPRDRVHVNAIGAYTPSMVEIPPAFVREAFVVVEDRAAAEQEAGDIIQADTTPDATLTEILNATVTPPIGRTLFKSVGIATLDVAAAVRAIRNAETMGIGQDVDFS